MGELGKAQGPRITPLILKWFIVREKGLTAGATSGRRTLSHRNIALPTQG
jgi:hypothetical protein